MKRNGDWNYGVFDKCCALNRYCCFAWCSDFFSLPCPTISLYSRSVDPTQGPEGHINRSLTYNYAFRTICCLLLLSFILSPAVIVIYLLALKCMARRQIRKIYKIKGNECTDFLCVFSLPCCSTIQMANQLWDNPGEYPGVECSSNHIHLVSNMPYSPNTPSRSNYLSVYPSYHEP